MWPLNIEPCQLSLLITFYHTVCIIKKHTSNYWFKAWKTPRLLNENKKKKTCIVAFLKLTMVETCSDVAY